MRTDIKTILLLGLVTLLVAIGAGALIIFVGIGF
jgi:hypothetical protein